MAPAAPRYIRAAASQVSPPLCGRARCRAASLTVEYHRGNDGSTGGAARPTSSRPGCGLSSGAARFVHGLACWRMASTMHVPAACAPASRLAVAHLVAHAAGSIGGANGLLLGSSSMVCTLSASSQGRQGEGLSAAAVLPGTSMASNRYRQRFVVWVSHCACCCPSLTALCGHRRAARAWADPGQPTEGGCCWALCHSWRSACQPRSQVEAKSCRESVVRVRLGGQASGVGRGSILFIRHPVHAKAVPAHRGAAQRRALPWSGTIVQGDVACRR